MLFIICSIISVFLICGQAAPRGGWSPNAANYPVGVVLDNEDRVWMYWKLEPDTQTILMEVHAKTLGWFGVGFSPNGAMTASDIVVGWVDTNGVPHLTDRHASANGFPPIDPHQDYKIVGGAKNSTHTMICFRRMMDTCDPDDFPIGDDTMHVLYAVSDHLPSNDNDIQKHESHNRGNRAVFFKDITDGDPNAPMGPDVKYMDFKSENVTVPEDYETLYWCHIFRLPQIGKQHMIRYEPVIQPGNEPYVHHMILYSCSTDMTKWENKEEPCFDQSGTHFSAMMSCSEQFLAGWAVGGGPHIYPDNVGYPLFEADDVKWVMLETHYDNSAYDKNIRDSSGLRIYYTNNFRPIEAGAISFGLNVGPLFQVIPPQQPQFINYHVCNKQCTSMIPPSGVDVFSGLLHTHLLGVQVRLRLIRNGVELPPIFEDKNYDFNYQEVRLKKPTVRIYPGDEFIFECVLNSMGKTDTTFSGFATQQEMCLLFAEYYPRTLGSLRTCRSWYDFNEAYGFLGAKNATTEGNLVQNSAGQWMPIEEWVKTEVNWGADDAKNPYGAARRFQEIVRDGTQHIICKAQATGPPPGAKLAIKERVGDFEVVHLEGSSKFEAAKSGVSKKWQYYTQQGLPNITTPYVPPNICLAQNNTTAAPAPSTSTPQKPSTAGGRLEVSTILALASLLISIFIGY